MQKLRTPSMLAAAFGLLALGASPLLAASMGPPTLEVAKAQAAKAGNLVLLKFTSET